MSKTDIVTTSPASLVAPRALSTRGERFRAYGPALESVTDPRCDRPIPRFFLELPWADDNDEVSDRIILQMLASDDPYAVQTDTGTTSGKSLIGRRIVAHDLRVRPSGKPGGWGAYLLLDCTIDDDDDNHVIVTIGARQAVATLAYAWQMGDFPVTGTVMVAATTSEGNDVLGFVVERAL